MTLIPFMIAISIYGAPAFDFVKVNNDDRIQVAGYCILDDTNNQFAATRIMLGGEWRTNWISYASISNWDESYTWVSLNSNSYAQILLRTSVWDQASVDATFSTNWIGTNTLQSQIDLNRADIIMIQGSTQAWDKAVIDAIFSTNWIATNIPPTGGDVYSQSNNTYLGGTTQYMDEVRGTNASFMGDVGIGTKSPDEELHVEGDILVRANLARIHLQEADNTNYEYQVRCSNSEFEIYNAETGEFPIEIQPDGDVILNDGNVGIGTVTPASTLHVVGSGYFTENLVVDKKFLLTDGAWEDLRFPANPSAVKNNADLNIDSGEGGINFETGCGTNILTDDFVYGIAQFPHGWKEDSIIEPHVHFIQTNADHTNSFYLVYRWYNIGDAVSDWVTNGPSSNMVAYIAGSLHQMTEFEPIDGTGMTYSSLFDWKILRDGSLGTGDILYKEFDIHYLADKLGDQ